MPARRDAFALRMKFLAVPAGLGVDVVMVVVASGTAAAPVKISPAHRVKYRAVASGGDTSYGVSAAGNVYAWGAGKFGAVGDGTKHAARTPVRVKTGATALISSTSNVVAVALRLRRNPRAGQS